MLARPRRGAARPVGRIALAGVALRGIGRRHRRIVTAAGSLAAAAVLGVVLAGRRHEFATAVSSASIWVLALAAALQIAALLARTEAWHGTIGAAGGTVARRVLYRASSMGYVASLLSAQVAMAARIAALRRSAPVACPGVSTLIAAEFPIIAVEAALAALASFTLVGPLGLPWWLPPICIAVVGALSAGLRHLALRRGREVWKGLAILRSMRGGRRLVGLVLIAVIAQIVRNWLLLHAVGVSVSPFDAVAVLIAMVALGQLPVGPSVGAAAAVLILGRHGVAAVAAAGLLTTVTGTVGGLAFAGWAGADSLWAGRRSRRTLLRAGRARAHDERLRAARADAGVADQQVLVLGVGRRDEAEALAVVDPL